MSTYLLLGLYFLAVLFIGYRSSRGESRSGYLVSDRDLSGFRIGTTLAISWAGGGYFAFYSEMARGFGWAGLVWMYVGVTLGFMLFMFIAKPFFKFIKKHRPYMISDYFRQVYSIRCGILSSLGSLVLFFGWMMMQYVIGGAILAHVLGIEYELAVFLMVGVTLPYVLLGGFKAIVQTDTLQFAMFTVFGALILWQIFTGFGEGESIQFPAVETLGSFGWYGTISFVLSLVAAIFASSDIWQRLYGAKEAKDVRSGAGWMMACFAILIAFIGLFAFMSFPAIPAEVTSGQDLVVQAFSVLLESDWAIVVYLLLFAAVMSSLDTTVFGTSMVIGNDVLRSLQVYGRDKLPGVIRVIMVIVSILAAFLAIYFTDIVAIFFGFVAALNVMAPILLVDFFTKWKLKERNVFWALLLGYALTFWCLFANPAILEEHALLTFVFTAIVLLVMEGESRLRKKKR